jgi:[acyl-carrier-protein] S-malonyltransferase
MSAFDGKTVALIFPGQGSQKVGMLESWVAASPEARGAFDEADAVLGFPLSRLAFAGPEDELNLTANTQPALLAASIAVYRALAASGALPTPVAMAGHSLGEYSALVAAGSLTFADALVLVRRRGELMQEAVPVGEGAMAAIIGFDLAQIGALAAEAADGEVCAIANLNGHGQTVLAGHRGAIDRAVALAKERGAKKATVLPVSAPFHSPLMRPAREGMEPLLAATEFRDPRVPVVTNVDAVPVTTAGAARDALIRQVDSPVRWVETVEWMANTAGVDFFVEVGPGNILSGMTRRIAIGARTAPTGEPEQWKKLVAEEEEVPEPVGVVVRSDGRHGPSSPAPLPGRERGTNLDG